MEDYRICKDVLLGSGTFGKVYLGYTKSNEKVAIKIVKRDKLKKLWKDGEQRQEEEIKFLLYDEQAEKYQEERNYVVKLFHVERAPQELKLVLEYCDFDFRRYLKKNQRYNLARMRSSRYYPSPKRKSLVLPVLDEVEIHYWLTQISQGLKYLRKKNIVHRDLKPENFLLKDKREESLLTGGNNNAAENSSTLSYSTYVLKLADLGFAKELPEDEFSSTTCGTILYMAPEILKRNSGYTASVDLWSVGVILFELVTGNCPSNITTLDNSEKLLEKVGKKLRLLDKFDISASLKELIKRLLTVNQERLTFTEFFEHPFITKAPFEQELVGVSELRGPEPVVPTIGQLPQQQAQFLLQQQDVKLFAHQSPPLAVEQQIEINIESPVISSPQSGEEIDLPTNENQQQLQEVKQNYARNEHPLMINSIVLLKEFEIFEKMSPLFNPVTEMLNSENPIFTKKILLSKLVDVGTLVATLQHSCTGKFLVQPFSLSFSIVKRYIDKGNVAVDIKETTPGEIIFQITENDIPCSLEIIVTYSQNIVANVFSYFTSYPQQASFDLRMYRFLEADKEIKM